VSKRFSPFLLIFSFKILKKIETLLNLNFYLNIITRPFGRLLLSNIFSNHERRITFTQRKLIKKFLIKNEYTLDEFVDNEFLKSSKILHSEKETLLIYIGDSLIEYLSRVKINGNDYKNSLAFWLGPRTRMGLTLESEMLELIDSITKAVLDYRKKRQFEELIIIWSSGSIDLRCSIYELKLRKLFSTPEELIQIYKESTQNLIQNIIKPLSDKLSTKNIVFISELDSTIKGDEPNSISDLKKIKRLNELPSLGSLEERFQWRNSLNIVTSELAIKNNYKFLDINPYLYKNLDQNKVQFDGVHISSPDIIIDINKNILGFFK
jgi:hypothetical protein